MSGRGRIGNLFPYTCRTREIGTTKNACVQRIARAHIQGRLLHVSIPRDRERAKYNNPVVLGPKAILHGKVGKACVDHLFICMSNLMKHRKNDDLSLSSCRENVQAKMRYLEYFGKRCF